LGLTELPSGIGELDLTARPPRRQMPVAPSGEEVSASTDTMAENNLVNTMGETHQGLRTQPEAPAAPEQVDELDELHESEEREEH